jgi:hypothetical protein
MYPLTQVLPAVVPVRHVALENLNFGDELILTMPAPNPETRALDPLRKRRKRLRYDVVVGLLFGIFVAFLIRNNVHTAQTMWKSAMTIRELPLEDVLQARILKSCLPTENKKCNQYIPEGTKAQRVAIVSPPGRLAMALERMVDHANNQQLLEGDYEFIRTSHVPPYVVFSV